MNEYRTLAIDIVKHVGGKENITDLQHCVTRLRLNLADESLADDEYFKNLDGVITIIKSMGQYMIVIGEHVPKVYEEVVKEIGFKKVTKEVNPPVEKTNGIMTRILNVITAGLIPALNLLCACGIIKGFSTIFILTGIFTMESGPYVLLTAIGDSIFYFLPLILGYNLASKLSMTPLLGLLIGASVCYPTINGSDIDLFGYIVNATYTSTFLPVVFMVCLAAPLERFLNKHIPEIVSGFFTPAIVLLTMVPIGFAFIGPAANLLGIAINDVIKSLLGVSPLLAGILFAGFWQVFVLFGIHGVLILLPMMEVIQGRPNQLLAFTAGASFAQIGVVLAIYLKTNDRKLKNIALPAFISGIFGVTEPAIYGVTLPRMKMFIISCFGAATGGVIAVLTGILQYTIAGTGIIGLLGFLSPANPNVIPILLLAIVPFLVSFAISYFVYREDKESKTLPHESEGNVCEQIFSPIKGNIVSLEESKDEAFSSGAIGEGVIIIPDENIVYAPFDGTIVTLFPTKHAIGILSKNGCELLIHIGIDTVRLNGEGFDAFVKQGDFVKKGQKLVSFDKELIKSKGYDLDTAVLITNIDEYAKLNKINNEHISNGEEIFTVIG